MCVIAVARDRAIRPNELRDMWDSNPHGAGVAWIERGQVYFEKGIMDCQDLEAILPMLPRPYVVHTRIATAGGVIPELTHPFLVAPDAPLVMGGPSGSPKGVMFHNGHWSDWEAHKKLGTPDLIGGLLSDSRLMAHIAATRGRKTLRRFVEKTQRLCFVTPSGVKTYGPGWSEVSGIEVSNRHWIWKPYKRGKGWTTKSAGTDRTGNLWEGTSASGTKSWSRQELLLDADTRTYAPAESDDDRLDRLARAAANAYESGDVEGVADALEDAELLHGQALDRRDAYMEQARRLFDDPEDECAIEARRLMADDPFEK